MFEQERTQLGILYRMPSNWDQNGANTIGFDSILKSITVITLVYSELGRRPYYICPSKTGGVGIEYKYKGSSIEIEIRDKEENFSYIVDLGTDVEDSMRYYIEDNVPLEILLYRMGQIVGPLEDVDEAWKGLKWYQMEPQTITLEPEEYEAMINLLEEPPEPNEKLVHSFHEYYQMIADGNLVTDVVSQQEAKDFLEGKSKEFWGDNYARS